MRRIRKERGISRREFIKGSSTIAAGALIMPGLLSSCSGRKSKNNRITIGHIGVGSRGTWELLNYFLPLKEAVNIAVCDVFRDRRETAAEEVNRFYRNNDGSLPECIPYPDYKEILQRDDIDAVHITTPDHWHILAAIEAARAGKHIMLAKPLGLSYPEYLILAKELADRDLRFHYGTQQRTAPHMQLGYNLINEGRLGDIERVEVWAPGINPVENPVCREVPVPPDFDFDRWTGPAPLSPYCPERVTYNGSFFNYDYSIGFLGVWGAHPLDIMVWILRNKVDGIYSCEGRGDFWPAGGLYNNIMSWDLNYKYLSGLEVHFVSEDIALKGIVNHRDIKEGNGTTFYGEKGWISLSRFSAQSNIPEIDQALNNFPKKDGWIVSETKTMGKVFIDIIQGRSKELCPLNEAIISDTISHMGDICIRTGRKVTWDPSRGEVTGDPEADRLYTRKMRSPYCI